MQYPAYKDKNGNLIEKGDVIRCIVPGMHEKDELVYANSYEDDLGINASNEKFPGFDPLFRKIYSLSQFDLNEWEIVKKGGK